MFRTVTVELKMKLVISVDKGIEIAEVVDELDYAFSLPDNATLQDSEILDYEVKDSEGDRKGQLDEQERREREA